MKKRETIPWILVGMGIATYVFEVLEIIEEVGTPSAHPKSCHYCNAIQYVWDIKRDK